MGWVISMQLYKQNLHQMKMDFPLKAILDAFAGGFFYAFLIFGPLYLIVAELMMLFIYRLYTWVILLMVMVALNGLVIHRLAEKALVLKKPDTTVQFRPLRVVHLLIWGLIVVIIGCAFLFFIIPALWV